VMMKEHNNEMLERLVPGMSFKVDANK